MMKKQKRHVTRKSHTCPADHQVGITLHRTI